MIGKLISSCITLSRELLNVFLDKITVVARLVGVLHGGPLILLLRLLAVVDGNEDCDKEQDAHTNNDPDPHHIVIARATIIVWSGGRIGRRSGSGRGIGSRHGSGIRRSDNRLGSVRSWHGLLLRDFIASIAGALECNHTRGGSARFSHAQQAVSNIENTNELLKEDISEIEVTLSGDIELVLHVRERLDRNAAHVLICDSIVNLKSRNGQVESSICTEREGEVTGHVGRLAGLLVIADVPGVVRGVIITRDVWAEELEIALNHLTNIRIDTNEGIARVKMAVGGDQGHFISAKVVIIGVFSGWGWSREQVDVTVNGHISDGDSPALRGCHVEPFDVAINILIVVTTDGQMSVLSVI